MLVYTHKITNRIRYIFGVIFKDILNVSFEVTSDNEHFESYEGPKFSYTKQPLGNELFFASEGLLFERGINHIDLVFIEYDHIPAFFPVYNKQSVMPFDPFAASFYMVSRYEEYLPYKKDEHGRFSAMESIAWKNGFLNKPVVNIWAAKIAGLLQLRFPDIEIKGHPYNFIPTIDIDAAWAYRQKGFFRMIGGYLGAASRFDFDEVSERISVQTGRKKDPFDTYDFQFAIHKKYKLKPVYFILFGEYGLNDKNIPVRNRKFHRLIKSLADRASVGIHPSYNSNFRNGKLKTEVERLSRVLHREITKSRQHFLVLQLPTTYRNLINLDITDDYSMGFAAAPGFRAGICSSYPFFDLDLDAITPLRIHPFTYMEGTLKDYMNLTPEQALDTIKPLIAEVKAVNGTFIPIWHNETLSDMKRWKGWQKVYEEMIKLAVP
ncbi:MAG: polysaccharide deacetylase family protein [Bacteroidales bacterium]|nr:polysaccharide deacetylase family protein [Bacteroidales bacterium]